jgi:adenosylhomocysteine nucleosidase
MKFHLGTLHGRPVVLAETGIGKVNAAMTTTLIIDRYRPSEIIFSGIAGGVSARVKPGDIVIGEKLAQHDYGLVTDQGMTIDELTSPIDGKRHPKLMPCDPRLVALAQAAAGKVALTPVCTTQGVRTPQVLTGIIATGDVFVASPRKKDELIKQLQADAVEMEGGAVVQVARQLQTPVLVVRSISDLADASAQVDLAQFFQVAAHNSAALVAAVVESLASPTPATHPAP